MSRRPFFFVWDYSQSVPSQCGTTLTAQTQSGLLPPLWLAGGKYLVRCAAQRSAAWTQTRLKAQSVRYDVRGKKKPATILRWKTQMLEGRNRVFLLICVSLRWERTHQRKTPKVHLHLMDLKIEKWKMSRSNPTKITFRRIRSACKVLLLTRQDLQISAERFHFNMMELERRNPA